MLQILGARGRGKGFYIDSTLFLSANLMKFGESEATIFQFQRREQKSVSEGK